MTEPANADAVLAPAEEGDAVPLAAVAAEAAEVGAAGADELELAPELQAAAPASRQAPTTAIRHLEPPGIRRDIPVKRAIAPSRLSAVKA